MAKHAMDSKRLILFIVLSFGLLLLWQNYFAPKAPPQPAIVAEQNTAANPARITGSPTDTQPGSFSHAQTINVSTDLVRAQIDTDGGDLRGLELLKQGTVDNPQQPFVLMSDGPERIYIAQTGLLSPQDPQLPTHKTRFTTTQTQYSLAPGQDNLEVRLGAPDANGIKVEKVYTFTRDSYVINVRYDISNSTPQPLNAQAYFRFLRDGKAPLGENRMAYTFTGPAVYTAADKFHTVSFEDLEKGKAKYPKDTDNGWVAMVQHYFVSAWLLSPENQPSRCSSASACQFELKPVPGGLYSAGVLVTLPTVAPGKTESFSMPLYAGPEITTVLQSVATGLDLTKDYGWTTIIATPLFWLLSHLYALVGNWGWAIVLLTLLIKAVFFPLSAASYRSMARMKALAPRLERLKKQHGDDRQKFQIAMMELYKAEKVNPLGGCLPILIQIPVFIGLYWSLLASVELRQAPWEMWIHDLSRPDPYYILPALMTITMFAQTFLNPPPADPVQAKMMKIMPLAFSAMFFFFPSGLVLYYLVNNLLSIAQQWAITRKIERSTKAQAQDKA